MKKLSYQCLVLGLLLSTGAVAQEKQGQAKQDGDDTLSHEEAGQQVQEIRIVGRLTEVRVKPETGPEYFFKDRGGDGTLSGRGGGEMESNNNIRTWKLGEW
jgi:hypothetical protein